MTRRWIAALVVLCFGGAVALQVAHDRLYPPRQATAEELYLTSGDTARRLALSYRALLADVYWIRAVQYFGSMHRSESQSKTYELLYPLLDITTTLDPAFNIAYRFGAIFLSEGYPHGPGRPDLAIALLDKGFRQNPHKWQYLYDKAFIYHWWLRNPEQASYWFAEAAKVPKSPEWMPGLAAFMLSQGRDRARSRILWQQIYRTAEHEYMRVNAEWRLRQLDAMDVIDRLNALLQRYEKEAGVKAKTWSPLVARGWLRGEPRDPAGGLFVIDANGQATVARESELHPLPTETAPEALQKSARTTR
jgi:tetratricopeptide (TPR) repeat protein